MLAAERRKSGKKHSRRASETLLAGAFGLTNLPFDVGRISGEATPSDKMMNSPETTQLTALL
ncbi:hypothetical protein NRL14_20480 [Pseudoalteromonas sp. 20-92]|uniref:hypothetical protein n=1 Tax=Pseudoalteromonas sp. 20-92 TaxID=2969394 RepID=UPI0027AE5FF1|nr:hypothetical protein [Pseudoalteromonas sp. 20-92]MDQ2046078.1 hypothetical protein [Pseudoalteromonas sp. 20-92]